MPVAQNVVVLRLRASHDVTGPRKLLKLLQLRPVAVDLGLHSNGNCKVRQARELNFVLFKVYTGTYRWLSHP